MGKKVEIHTINGRVMKYAVKFEKIEPDYDKITPASVESGDPEPTILIDSWITLFTTESMAMDSIIHAQENNPFIKVTEIGWVSKAIFS